MIFVVYYVIFLDIRMLYDVSHMFCIDFRDFPQSPHLFDIYL
jgi:hypothetical protein